MLVKTLRQKNNWSQEQLAHLSGLNIRTIQRAEKGDSVGIETMKALASVFHVDVNELKNDIQNGAKHDEKAANNELKKREELAKAEVQSKKEFYILALFLLGIFVFFLLPNYNGGENLNALIVTGICFIMIIVVHGVMVFQPFGENWEKKKIKQVMESYEKDD